MPVMTSDTTVIKHEIFNYTVNNLLDKTYKYYVDLNSGPGYDRWKRALSPIMTLEAAIRNGIKSLRCFLCEIDEDAQKKLHQHTQAYPYHIRILPDQKEIVEYNIPKVRGLVYSDDNGIADFNLLHEMSKNPKLDILIHLQHVSIARIAGRKTIRNKHEKKEALVYLDMLNRKHWYIRYFGPRVMVFGTNVKTNNLSKYYHFQSEVGQILFKKLNSKNATAEDYKLLDQVA